MNNEYEHVAVFWDYENCAPPSWVTGYDIVDNIRRIAHTYGSVKLFKAYLELSQLSSSRSLSLRSELQSCGVSLTDCPHNGGKDVADKMMIVDMLTYAIDTPPPATIIIITGDRDFVYAVSVLRLRRYRVVLIAPLTGHNSLRSQASAVLDWDVDVLGKAGRESNRASHRRFQSSSVPALATTSPQKGQRRLSFRDNAVPSLAEPLQPALPIHSPGWKKPIQTSLPAVNAVEMADTELPDAELSEVDPEKKETSNSSPLTAGYATAAKAVQTAEDVEDIVGSGVIADLNLHLHNLHNQQIYANLLPESSADVSETSSNTPIHPNEVEQQTPLGLHVADEGSEYKNLMDRPSSSPPILRKYDASPTQSYHRDSISSERVTTLGATPMTPAQEIAIKHETKPAEPIPNYYRLLLILRDLQKRGMSRPLRTVVCNMILHRYGREAFTSAGVNTWSQYAAAAESVGIVTLGGEQGGAWISLNETRFLPFQAYLEDVEQQENKPEESQPPFVPTIPVSAEHANAELPATSQPREDIAEETDAVETHEPIGLTPLDPDDMERQGSALPPIPIYHYDLLVVLETFMRRGVYSPRCEDVSRALLQRNPNIYQYAGVETWEAYASQALKLGMVMLGSLQGSTWISLRSSWYGRVPVDVAGRTVDTKYIVRESKARGSQEQADIRSTHGQVPPAEMMPASSSPPASPIALPGDESIQPILPHNHSEAATAKKLSEDIAQRTDTVQTSEPIDPTFPSESDQGGQQKPALKAIIDHYHDLIVILLKLRKSGVYSPLCEDVSLELLKQNPGIYQHAGVETWEAYASQAVKLGIVVLGSSKGSAWIALKSSWCDVLPASYAAEVHDLVFGSAVEAPSVQPTLMPDRPHSPVPSVSPQDGPAEPTLPSLAPHFLALVTVLERFRLQNITQPLRSTVNVALMEEDPNAFRSAGVTRWKQFADLAVQEGIVVLGGLHGAAWISLEPSWHSAHS